MVYHCYLNNYDEMKNKSMAKLQINQMNSLLLPLLIFISFNFNSCDRVQNTNEEKTLAETSLKDSIIELKSNKTIETDNFITTPCAIIVSPTAHKVDSLKKINEEDFYTVADDNQFYIAVARKYLDSTKATIINKESIGSLKFKINDGKIVESNLSELCWGILLFNGQAAPIQADISVFSSEYKKYMNIKK